MDTAQKVIEALKSWKGGDRLFDAGDFKASASSYQRALELSRSIPAEDKFDHRGFEASCNAGLSGSLGRHRDSLTAADAALAFFDRCGDMYPVEAGKWIMAVVNRGAVLGDAGSSSGSTGGLPARREDALRARDEQFRESTVDFDGRPEHLLRSGHVMWRQQEVVPVVEILVVGRSSLTTACSGRRSRHK